MSELRTTYNKVANTWSGPRKTLLFNPEASLGQVLLTCLTRQHPDNVLQINDGEQTQLTSEQVLSLSLKIAFNLQKLDLKQTDIVGIIAPNTTNLMPLCYGMLFIGVPFHAIDYELSKNTAVRMWGKTRPKVIFCAGSKLLMVKEVISELDLTSEVYTLNEHHSGVKRLEDLLQALPSEVKFSPSEIISSRQTAAISNSSGSTGFPKAVTLSHSIILETLSTLTETPFETNLVLFSLHWECGILDFLVPAVTGCTNIISNKCLAGDAIVKLTEKYKVTGLILMPMFIAQMLHSPSIEKCSLESLQSVVSIGAKFHGELRHRLAKHLSKSCKISDNFGCSERGSIMMELSEHKVIPFYNVEIKIIDEYGNSLDANQDGQVCVRKDSPWSGYFGDQEATDEVYDRSENWYKTGDLGHFDEKGYFYFVDRIKDIIRLEMFDISPAELENIILGMPDVAEVCVFGIPHEFKFNIAGALVIKKSEGQITEKDVERHVAKKAPEYMHLEGGAYFVDGFPLTSTGKIIRRKVSEIGANLYERRFVK